MTSFELGPFLEVTTASAVTAQSLVLESAPLPLPGVSSLKKKFADMAATLEEVAQRIITLGNTSERYGVSSNNGDAPLGTVGSVGEGVGSGYLEGEF